MANTQRDPAREQFWRNIIAEQQASGRSIREFCRRRQLTETSFHSWRRELQRRDAQARPTFVPVTVIPSTTTTVEVRCPSGHVVSLASADAATLRELFAALAEASSC